MVGPGRKGIRETMTITKPHRFYLSRQANGSYMLTLCKPVRAKVRGSGHDDLYICPGEPIGVRHWCPEGVGAVFGVELDCLETCKVEVQAGPVEPAWRRRG